MRRIRSGCARAAKVAALPSIEMNSRRFTPQYLQCLPPEGQHTSVGRETAALQDFNPRYDGSGVQAV